MATDTGYLLVSYVPDNHDGPPLMTETKLSDSYEQVIEEVCTMWDYCLPPPEQRVARLARQRQRPDGTCQWITLHPDRFADLARNSMGSGGELELRLQIDRIAAVSSTIRQRQTAREAPSAPEHVLSTSESSGSINNGSSSTTAHDSANHLHLDTQQVLDNPSAPVPSSAAPALHQSPLSFTHTQGPPDPAPPVPRTASQTDILFENGIAAFLAGKHDEARTNLSRAAQDFHQQGDVRSEADCLRHVGISYRHLKEYVAARSHLRAARALYESLGAGYRQEQLRCDRHLIRVEVDAGNHDAALVAYQQLLQTTERERLLMQRAWCLCYIAHLRNRMGQYDEAALILQDVVVSSQRTPSLEIEGFAMEEFGYTFERRGQREPALDSYARALQVYKAGGDGKWIESENRVIERMKQLRRQSRRLTRGWSISRRE